MSSLYPAAFDALPTSHQDFDPAHGIEEVIHASYVNDLADAVNKIQAALGLNPQGSYGDVKTRLADLGGIDSWDLINQGDLVGDGSANDTTKFIAAKAAAGGTKVLTSPPGKIYRVDSEIDITDGGALMDLRGSTIKKDPTMTGQNVLVVSGAEASLRNGIIDGNRAGGAGSGGIVSQAAGIEIVNWTVKKTKQNAFVNLSGDTDYIHCLADDVDDGFAGGGSANGFLAVGGVSRWHMCRAQLCTRAGFSAADAGSAGSFLSGFASRCGRGVEAATCNGGHIGYLLIDDCDIHDAYFNTVNDWTIDYLESRNAGLTAGTGEASGAQINGCLRFRIGSLIVYNALGYGLALAGGSSHNSVGNLMVYSAGDPGLHFSGGASHNHIASAYIRAATWASIFGEGLAGSNDHNLIGLLHAIECPYGAARFDNGSYNHIARLFSRDSYTTDATYNGLVTFAGSVTKNIIGFLDARASGTKPSYVVRARDTAAANYVMDGFGPDFITAQILDSPGTNFISPVLAAAGALRT